jgi:steroid delta-isomerase-like uncharacterized protein
MALANSERTAARLQLVEEHVRYENDHDLDGILSTFGETALYEEQPWGERHEGLDRVRAYYAALVEALPDLSIDIQRWHITEDAVILEVTISGTHLGAWRGVPATGRRVDFPLCGVYTFTADNKLAGERIYYDRATVLRQLGLYHEPLTVLGRVTTALMHPWTVGRAYARQLVGDHSRATRRRSPGPGVR